MTMYRQLLAIGTSYYEKVTAWLIKLKIPVDDTLTLYNVITDFLIII